MRNKNKLSAYLRKQRAKERSEIKSNEAKWGEYSVDSAHPANDRRTKINLVNEREL